MERQPLVHAHNGRLFSDYKGTSVTHGEKWMNIMCIMLNGRGETPKATHCMIPFFMGIGKTRTEHKSVVARARRG